MVHTRDITGVPQVLARPSRATRARLAAVALLAFALRALIPLGFMPASDGSLSLMICPGGLPAGLLEDEGQDQGQAMGQSMGTRDGSGHAMGKTMAQSTGNGMPMSEGMPTPAHPHDGGHGLMDEGYCAFTTGFSSAPPPLLLIAVLLLLSCVAVIAVTVLAPTGVRLVHLPQARAPPAPF